MIINQVYITSPTLTVFQNYLLNSSKIKELCKQFNFYQIRFYKEMFAKDSVIVFDYPKANIYWYLDFKKYVYRHILKQEDCAYKEDWEKFLITLKSQIKTEYDDIKWKLDHLVTAKDVVSKQLLYSLRDYQAFDLCQLIIKYRYWDNNALILSEQRTGKTRIAIALAHEVLQPGDLQLVVCPKAASLGWSEEIHNIEDPISLPYTATVIKKMSDLRTLELNSDAINVRIVSYDLFKKFTNAQLKLLTSKCKHILFTVDEVHRLRNFKTDQSKAIFNFKEFCKKESVDLGCLGMTGTPGVKEDSDIFGTLCFINNSKINFNPYWYSFDNFIEYFYYYEDTSFGRKTKALRREAELNFISQIHSVQTKQKDLEFFVNYTKKYHKIELDMDEKQKEIYDSVYETMEYDEDIDCQNKLVQLVRLQQICIDPSGLIANYDLISPKLKYIIYLAKTYKGKFLVACKKVVPIKHLMELFDKESIPYASYIGEYNYTKRKDELVKFKTSDCKCMFLQLDAGKEALTLPEANAIVFLDRDFAQGFNEQAEARMTPIDGCTCTKHVIDLIMRNTKEEEIYQTLVIKKKSITAINTVFKSKKGD